MGTYYALTFKDSLERDLQVEIDQLLDEINGEVSTYVDTSIISKFNQSKEGISLGENFAESHFYKNLQVAIALYKVTNRNFDPTVMPLVNYWGFGYDGNRIIDGIDTLKIKELLESVGLEKTVALDDTRGNGSFCLKVNRNTKLDFSALAKGYAVDQIADLLEKKGITNYLVDIGGEVKAKGKNRKGEWWKIGIKTPKEGVSINDYSEIVVLQDRALATSGNYINFYEVDGQKFSHTINPFTGFPERSNLLSASVFYADCIYADALATAFMVMGLDKSYELAKTIEDLDALFIYADQAGELKVKYTDNQNTTKPQNHKTVK